MEKLEKIGLNETVIRPRFNEIDSLAIVHHSRFVAWIEEANFNFIERVLDISRTGMFELEMYNPIKKLEIDYRNHIGWKDTALIKCHMEYNQFAYFTMYNTMHCIHNPDKIFAEAKVKFLITDKNLNIKILAPDFFIKKVERIAAIHPQYFTRAVK